jgi:hypothetical protein
MAGIWFLQGIVGEVGRAAEALPICQEVFDVEVNEDGAMTPDCGTTNRNGCTSIVLPRPCPLVAEVCQQPFVNVNASY